MYIDIYYWITIIVFLLWIILFIAATCIPIQFDSMGNAIQNNSYILRDRLFTIGFIFMGIFITLIFMLFLFIYFSIPIHPEDTGDIIKSMFIKK